MVRWKAILAMVLVLSAVIPSILAATDVIICDVLDNPSRWYNLEVRIQGKVVNVVSPKNIEERGFYVVLDKCDKTIKVKAETLPAPEETFYVTGIVQIDTETQVPFIRESSRGPVVGPPPPPPPPPGLSPLVIGLIALIAVVVIALLFVMLRKKPEPAAAPVMAPPPSPAGMQASAPQAPPAPARTQQVSMTEIARQVGGIKTTQVPNILAQVSMLTGPLAGKNIPLKYETGIGREIGDILLDDSSVSREHAKIIFAGDKYVLENKSTTNPVILNGEKVTGRKELKAGDEIICGFVKMKFSLI